LHDRPNPVVRHKKIAHRDSCNKLNQQRKEADNVHRSRSTCGVPAAQAHQWSLIAGINRTIIVGPGAVPLTRSTSANSLQPHHTQNQILRRKEAKTMFLPIVIAVALILHSCGK
jgi:hypothetical protein